jgi:hypothetical protein
MKMALASRWLVLVTLPAALLVSACGRTPSELGDHTLGRVDIMDRTQAGHPVVATWQQGAGWSGALPAISLSAPQARLELGARITSAAGVERPLTAGGEYSVRWDMAPNAPAGIVAAGDQPGARFHGDYVHVYGLTAGTTQIRFLLWHFSHADGATPPIDVTVTP